MAGVIVLLPSKHKIAVVRLMQRLQGFAQGLHLDEATVGPFVESNFADMSDADNIDRQAEARNWMLHAARLRCPPNTLHQFVAASVKPYLPLPPAEADCGTTPIRP